MHLKSLTIENYKCFYRPTTIEFDKRMTIIVGRNNVGKSALFEAIGFEFGDEPHTTAATKIDPDHRPDSESRGQQVIVLSGKDLERAMTTYQGCVYLRGAPGDQNGRMTLGSYTSAPKLELVATRPVNLNKSDPALGLREYQKSGTQHSFFCDGRSPPVSRVMGTPIDIRMRLSEEFSKRRFVFRGERMNIGESPIENTEILAPNADNLPGVISLLQSRRPVFDRYVDTVRRVLPQVRGISAPPHQDDRTKAEVRVWSLDPESERDDLAIPLRKSGTGVAQVLAILYVVVASRHPCTIAIDEPNSFLHPGAVAALFDVFWEYPHHQYIVATHSPAVISAASPGRLWLIENEENVAHLEEVDSQDLESMSAILPSVGATLADVFGPDEILWVEGKTEQQCFPLIAAAFHRRLPPSTAVYGVINTGDVVGGGDRARLVAQIYRRLSEGAALIPPAVGFIFDRETLTEKQQQATIDACPGKLRFIPRRMFENYLLDEHAVATVMNRLDTFTNAPVSPETVAAMRDRLAIGGSKGLSLLAFGSLASLAS